MKNEVKRILNCIPSRGIERDWRVGHAREAGLLRAGAIPKKADWRAGWWKVGDQKETGSCVGWAMADSVVRRLMAESGRIKQSDLLSPRFVWMAAKESDEWNDYPTTFIELEGTSLKAALDVARKLGMVTTKVLPFEPPRLYPGPQEAFYAIAAKLKIASYINLGNRPVDWKAWLAQRGPILARLDVDATWDNADKTKGRLDRYLPETARGGHAVALVGYDEKYFIVRNSWGASWGDRGYAYASYSYTQAAFSEAYGITL